MNLSRRGTETAAAAAAAAAVFASLWLLLYLDFAVDASSRVRSGFLVEVTSAPPGIEVAGIVGVCAVHLLPPSAACANGCWPELRRGGSCLYVVVAVAPGPLRPVQLFLSRAPADALSREALLHPYLPRRSFLYSSPQEPNNDQVGVLSFFSSRERRRHLLHCLLTFSPYSIYLYGYR